jgi:hypothetical protein
MCVGPVSTGLSGASTDDLDEAIVMCDAYHDIYDTVEERFVPGATCREEYEAAMVRMREKEA